MAVVKHTHHPRGGSRTISRKAVPRANGEAILFVKDGCSHEGRCRMARRERVSRAVVGSHLVGRVLDGVYDYSHNGERHGTASQITNG